MPRANRFAFNRSYSRSIHAKVRAHQRYQIQLSPAQSVKIGQYIRDQRGEVLKPGTNAIVAIQLSEIDDQLPDRRAIVVYDRRKREVVTFLPDHWRLEGDEQRRDARPLPTSNVPKDRSLKAMTMEETKDWRKTLVDASAMATTPKDRTTIQKMIMRANSRMEELRGINQKAKKVAKGHANKLRKIEEAVIKEEKMQEIFRQLWDSVED